MVGAELLMTRPLIDPHGRVHRDLRVSLTDKCNLRCTYCMPAEGLPWLPKDELLTTPELLTLVEAAVTAGITEVRLTGGEPLVRPDVVEIVAGIAAMEGPQGRPEVSMTTNGLGLAKIAPALKEAGLARVNVSLDTLHPERFHEITRRDRFDDVVAGMAAAHEAGLRPVKVNSVLQRGINDDEVVDLTRWAVERGYELRFIEQMPLDAQHSWERTEMITGHEILASLRAELDLEELRARCRTGRALPHRRRPGDGGCRRLGDDALLRVVRPAAPHGRRPAAQLPLRQRRDGPARAAAFRRDGGGDPCSRARVLGPQAARPRDQRARLPPTAASDERDRRVTHPPAKGGSTSIVAPAVTGVESSST